MKKYELTNKIFKYKGRTLHIIKALIDFSDVKKGDLGGYVESEDNLSHKGECWIYGNAKVYDNAEVFGNAWVGGNAKVYGNARVCDDAWVCVNAKASGDILLCGGGSYGSRPVLYFKNNELGFRLVENNLFSRHMFTNRNAMQLLLF